MQDGLKEWQEPRPVANSTHTPPPGFLDLIDISPKTVDSVDFQLRPGSKESGCSGSRCGSRGSFARRGSRGDGSRCGSRGEGSRCGSRGGSRRGSSFASRGPSRTSTNSKCGSRPPSHIGFQRTNTLYREVLQAIQAESGTDFRTKDTEDQKGPDNFVNTRPATVSTGVPLTRGTDIGNLDESLPDDSLRSLPGDVEESKLWTADEDDGAGEWLARRKTRLLTLHFDDDDLEEAGEDDEDTEDVEQGKRKSRLVPMLKPRCGLCPPAAIDTDSVRYPNRFLSQMSKTSLLKISKMNDKDRPSALGHWNDDVDKLTIPPLMKTAFDRKRHPVFKHLTNRKLYHMDNQMRQYKVKAPLLKELVASLDGEAFNFKYRAMREDMELSRMRMIVGKKVRNRTFEDTVALVGYLKKHRFFMDLQIDILHKIGCSLQLRRFEVNEVVWRETQEIEGIYIVLRGHMDLSSSGEFQPVELDGTEEYIFVKGEKVLGLRELLVPSRGGPPRLKKYAHHSTTALAIKVVEGLFIDKDVLRTILDNEATAERLKVLKELWPETMSSSTEHLCQPSNLEQDGHRMPIHRLFNVEVFPCFYKFFEKGTKSPWDLAHITLIIEGQVELQIGMQVTLIERGAIIGKEPLTGDFYTYTAVVKSEKVRAMQIRVQDYATEFCSQTGVIGQLRTRAREARKHLEDGEKKDWKSGLKGNLLLPAPSQRSNQRLSMRGQQKQKQKQKLAVLSNSPEQSTDDIPSSGIELKTFTIEDLAHPSNVARDRQLVLDMHPHLPLKKLPPRRMPPIDKPTVFGRKLTEAADDIAEKPTTRRMVLKRTATQKVGLRPTSNGAQRLSRQKNSGEQTTRESFFSAAPLLQRETRAVCTQVVLDAL